jgi:hypothetical protein
MGTRCLTRFYDDEDGKELLSLYRQYDGYPSGHGSELKEILSGVVQAGGISLHPKETRRIFLGAAELPILVISGLKRIAHERNQRILKEVPPAASPELIKGFVSGGVYLNLVMDDADVAYVYGLRPVGNGKVAHLTVRGYEGMVLYEGPIDEFYPERLEQEE